MLRKLMAILVAIMVLGGSAYAVSLSGAGATFPYPIYSKWNSVYGQSSGVQINYQGIGSGGGVRQFMSGITDFGGTDDPMTDSDIAKAGGDVLHIPTVMGAVAVAYNLPEVSSLKLDGETLAKIFMGKIKKWNDADIADLNPGVNLPSTDITVARRSDGSGTTFIFTSYLAKASLGWATQMGKGKALSWPVGVGGKGNAGVAGIIKVNKGAIGYVELSYAISNNLPVASLKNKAGNFVKPSLDSTSAAAAGVMTSSKIKQMIANGDFRIDLTNAVGANSYPIVGLTWIIAHANQGDKTKGKALVDYLKWALTTGQQYAPELLYAPLPDNMRSEVLESIATIKI
jgi:phosphate transport system substrate-binding protein